MGESSGSRNGCEIGTPKSCKDLWQVLVHMANRSRSVLYCFKILQIYLICSCYLMHGIFNLELFFLQNSKMEHEFIYLFFKFKMRMNWNIRCTFFLILNYFYFGNQDGKLQYMNNVACVIYLEFFGNHFLKAQ